MTALGTKVTQEAESYRSQRDGLISKGFGGAESTGPNRTVSSAQSMGSASCHSQPPLRAILSAR